VKESAAALDCPERRIRNLIYLKRFPYHKIAGRIKTSEEELHRWLQLSQKISAEEAIEKPRAAE
jgi:hypothetical protein